eukprot:scaffold213444_cov19-Tisochrysis_lutea.AAC.1
MSGECVPPGPVSAANKDSKVFSSHVLSTFCSCGWYSRISSHLGKKKEGIDVVDPSKGASYKKTPDKKVLGATSSKEHISSD